MKKRNILILMFLLILLSSGCHLFPDRPGERLEPIATVCGYVSYTRGGPVLAGARVYGIGFETVTDEDGYFELTLDAENEFDLLVEKEGYASALVQDIYLEREEILELEIPCREYFNPQWSMSPPRLIIEGVERGQKVRDTFDIRIAIEGERDTLVFYVYFMGQQRSPVEFSLVGHNEGTGTIDTNNFPDGKGSVRILAYDDNGNSVMKIIPIVIDNKQANAGGEKPGRLQKLTLGITTHGQVIGYYSQKENNKLPSSMGNGTGAFKEDANISATLEWYPVHDAKGYNVYRSLDGVEYKWIGSIASPKTQYQDFSPVFAPGETIYYEVVPYNRQGESSGLQRSAVPLPPFNINLLEPANNATGVPRIPTLKWQNSIQFDSDVDITYNIRVFFAARPMYWAGSTKNATVITMPDNAKLEPGSVYSWDVFEAEAMVMCEQLSPEGYSWAKSIAGNGNGSQEGEFIFTTTMADQ